MFSNTNPIKVYTPEQVAEILQLSKATVYSLIARGEIAAQKIGKVYRIPASSILFAFTEPDSNLYEAEQKNFKAPDMRILDSLVGSIKFKGAEKTNFAQNIDEIYQND